MEENSEEKKTRNNLINQKSEKHKTHSRTTIQYFKYTTQLR